jgi:MFS family permease
VSGSGTALLCLMVFANTVCVGAFGPLLPEIARAQSLADWQLGLLAGSFGFARMIADVPTGLLAGAGSGRRSPPRPRSWSRGVLLLWSAGPFPVLVLGRVLVGLGHSLGMVAGLTAILLDQRGAAGSMRLNVFEFAGMAGVLGGLAGIGLLPAAWGWPRSLIVACSPVLITVLLVPRLRRQFPDQPRAPAGDGSRALAAPALAGGMPPMVWLMFGVGIIMALAWSSMSQFLIPLRATREFGLDRAGVSQLLGLAQVVDLLALLPVGWLADRVGRVFMLSAVSACLGFGAFAVGLGSFPFVWPGACSSASGWPDGCSARGDSRAHGKPALRVAHGLVPGGRGRGGVSRAGRVRAHRGSAYGAVRERGGRGRLRRLHRPGPAGPQGGGQ